ncbi:alpha/beta hydrolase [Luteimonas composti]|uniref:Alpha/beta hydrolase n=1 Tax=Luteimonas composti TaxID=398257 RepID=A0ABT6MS97_9GAMM|nr:alpha/beta hydrolase [Luteimonas composti]MDH7453514.1 alpha/beta hydrolase [Luteimonas composti]
MSDSPVSPIDSPARPPVLLIHGIWNARLWLLPLARKLRAAGFDARIWGYSSVLDDPAHAARALAERLRGGPQMDLVGYSLGGLVALEALRIAPALPVRRVVCLGSPLCGSCTARSLGAHRWSSPLLGRSARLLQRGLGDAPPPVEVGVVAGCVPRGLGRLLAVVDPESDGTVAIAETRVPGLRDHCIVQASHSGLLLSPQAARQAACFLRSGRFEHGDDAPNV